MPWFVQSKGDVLGPYSDADFKKLATTGVIVTESSIAQSRTGPWFPASSVKGLFDGVAISIQPSLRADVLVSRSSLEGSSHPIQTKSGKYADAVMWCMKVGAAVGAIAGACLGAFLHGPIGPLRSDREAWLWEVLGWALGIAVVGVIGGIILAPSPPVRHE